jgi:penicillin-binding protein 1A
MAHPQPKRSMKAVAIALLAACVCLPLAVLAAAYIYFSHDLPRIGSLHDYRPPLVTELYSSDGTLIGEFFLERRYLVSLDRIAPEMIQAIIATEDDRFFEHKGINFWSILRAALKNMRAFEIRQGGSTITQQIVKSLLLTPEKNLPRKIKEAILAVRIEKSLTKEEILTLYLNQIYFGRGAYGVEAAARVYFDRSASELSLAESSFLAGLPRAPNYYRNPERGEVRRRYVLSRMFSLGYISRSEMTAATQETLVFAASENINLQTAPYVVEYIRREIERTYGVAQLYTGGLRVETTLDAAMQAAARDAVRQGVAAYEERRGTQEHPTPVQAALVCLDPYSGHVKALVGGRDFSQSQFNRALQAQRQPGSAFKPLIYAAALDKGYTPASIILDSPLVYVVEEREDGGAKKYDFWEPQNYDKAFHGPITFRRALTQSRNIVTIKLLQDIGIDYVVRYSRKLGVAGEFNRDLSLALGTCGISLINMVKAYAAFCAQGTYPEPLYVSRIIDRDGQVLEEGNPVLVPALSPQTAYIMTTMLQSVVEEGTGRRVRALSRPCAGKTGTTNDVRDAWFIGFTPEIVTGVWVGFDDLAPLGKNETGAVAAGPIWLDFMQRSLQDQPSRSFKVPEGIVFVRINPETGYYPESRRDATIFECFKEGTLPMPFMPEQLPGGAEKR